MITALIETFITLYINRNYNSNRDFYNSIPILETLNELIIINFF